MIETVETVKDVEKSLAEARAKLQGFEDGVDRARLLKRLKLASPAHPVLLFRAMFALLTFLVMAGILAVLVIPMVNSDLARTLAKFDAIVPAPPGVPGLPALLCLLALCMIVGWGMTTMAALAMGRDAQMLPWEQKQHQKLVNEVTRLTTQKAVMERMRSTPAGARPRIETPVPVSLRERSGMQTPSALGRMSDSHAGGPPRIGGMQPGRFGGASGSDGPASVGNPFGRAPGSGSPPAATGGGGGGGGLFGAPAPATPAGAPRTGGGGFSSPASGTGGGVLARARSGALKTTPAGAAGRLTPAFNRPDSSPSDEEGSDDGGPFAGSGQSYGTPAAAPPSNAFAAAPASSNPFGGRPAPSLTDAAPPASNPFGGAASVSPSNPFGGSSPSAQAQGASVGVFGSTASTDPEPSDDFPNIVDSSPSYSSEADAEAAIDDNDSQSTEAFPRSIKPPSWGAIDDPWLEEAVERVEALAARLPMQAHLSYSEETYLPFTLVIARASPTVAVKALVAYVEFLASIPTPPRARIELNASPGLDRSFHRNVEAALQPIYKDDFEVDLEPGRVEVLFKQPDPAWQDHPILPIQ